MGWVSVDTSGADCGNEVRASPVVARYKPSPGLLVVAVAGALDRWSAAELGAALSHPCDPDVRDVIVDLSEVSVLDASSFRELEMKADELDARGGSLSIVDPRCGVSDPLGLRDARWTLSISNSLETALGRYPRETEQVLTHPVVG